MEKRLPFKLVKSQVENLFSEWVDRNEVDIQTLAEEKIHRERIYKRIDFRNRRVLYIHVRNRLKEFLKEHPDNTLFLFKEREIARAKDYQTYFPNYTNTQEHKENYFALDRYIKAVEAIRENEKHICDVPFIGELLNRNVHDSKAVLAAYYRLVPQPRTREEIPESYVGEVSRHNQPFETSVEGAFPIMFHLEAMLHKRTRAENQEKRFKHYLSKEFYEGMQDYAMGFQLGFDTFIEAKVKSQAVLSQGNDSLIQKVFDFISEPFLSTGFSETISVYKEKVNPFENWYNDGIKAGYFYHAWYLILDNHRAFEPLFVEREKPFSNEQQTPPKQPQTFDALFINTEIRDACVSALQKTVPIAVNMNLEYLLGERKKGVITAWVQAMRQKGLIGNIDDARLARLINTKISGLNLGEDGRTLRNIGTTAYNKHYTNLLILLPDLPLLT